MKSHRIILIAFGFAAAILFAPAPKAAASPHGYHRCHSCGFWGSPWWGWDTGYRVRSVDLRFRQWARVDLDVEPEEAEVILDGQSIGLADDFDGFPDFLYLRTGNYELEFRYPGHESHRTSIDVKAGRSYDLKPELPRLAGTKKFSGGWDDNPPARATKHFFGSQEETETSESEVSDDDYDESPRPIRRPARVRPRTNEVESNDTENDQKNEQGGGLQSDKTTFELKVSPDSAEVWLDGVRLGSADEVGENVKATAGRHELVVMKRGFETRVIQIDVDESGETQVVIRLDPSERSE